MFEEASLFVEKKVGINISSTNLFAAQDKLTLGNKSEGNERQDVIGQSGQNRQDLGHQDQSGGGFKNLLGTRHRRAEPHG